ncbi:MAG: AMP-dependent synthetase [Candidimonas sp.]|nr:MAG: AMP-dependent synthetase [Candidimonas sp.]TAM23303.1 MAG: AMP-dependent synthetase [Candidimonas sp.]TAM77109.1 MAG: AMP-dependent synthetase [Candidimonas sp.]
MHPYLKYFPARSENDNLDIVKLLYEGLNGDSTRPLLAFEEEEWDVARIRRSVTALQCLFRDMGITTGDRVALMLDNSPFHVACIYSLVLLGAVWIPLNTKLKSASIDYQLDHCRPKIVLVDHRYSEVLESISGKYPGMTILDSENLLEDHESGADLLVNDVGPECPLCIIYTSGTTGAPKGVVFTHRMMRIASESARIVANIRAGDRPFLWEPLCHIGGAQMLMVPILEPACLVIVPSFSASRFWTQIQDGKCTQLHYLGGILDILMHLPVPARSDRQTLRLAWGAGMSVSAWRPIRDRFLIEFRECYGMTEGASFATMNTANVPGSIGKPLPWLAVELLDESDAPVAVGKLGQVVISSEIEGNFFPGYLDDAHTTSQVLRNGKLYTGDMARADSAGNLYFVGRKTESMRVRGENVSAWEIERVFLEHPDIASAAAIGVKSEIGEQEILLYIQWKENSSVSFPDLATWARNRLASFQVPRYYQGIDRFELTPSERIRKHMLSQDISGAWDRMSALKLA